MPTETQGRAAILSVARGFIGSHYLAGTFGAIPGVPDTFASDRNILSVMDINWRSIGIHTAEIPAYEGRRLRCCGRYAAVGGSFERWSRFLPPPAGEFGVWLDMVRDALGSPQPGTRVFFRPYRNGMYPRRHCFVAHGRHEDPDLVYFGEACAGKHHFDCVGFVCRVLSTALGREIRYGLPWGTTCGNWLQDGSTQAAGRKAENCNRAQPGDIFLSASHMALVYERRGNIRLIHAAGDRRGVEITDFNSSDSMWQENFHVVYLSPRFLRATPEVAVAAAS